MPGEKAASVDRRAGAAQKGLGWAQVALGKLQKREVKLHTVCGLLSGIPVSEHLLELPVVLGHPALLAEISV